MVLFNYSGGRRSPVQDYEVWGESPGLLAPVVPEPCSIFPDVVGPVRHADFLGLKEMRRRQSVLKCDIGPFILRVLSQLVDCTVNVFSMSLSSYPSSHTTSSDPSEGPPYRGRVFTN